MGLGSDIVARLHAPLAAAAAVVGAAAASSADLRPERLQSRAVTPLILYSAHHSSGPTVHASSNAVMLQTNLVSYSTPYSGPSLPASASSSSQRLYGAPSICFYGGADLSVPVCFSGLQRSCSARASPFSYMASVASSPLIPLQFYSPRLSTLLHTLSEPRLQVESCRALAFLGSSVPSVLSPASHSSRISCSGLHASIGRLPPSKHLDNLLSSLVDSYQWISAVPSSFTKAALQTWNSSSPGPLDIDSGGHTGLDGQDKPALTVVLLGWLGSRQKHLRKYAEWYTARGIHAVTFVIPIKDVLMYRPGGKAEEHVDNLAQHLVSWLNDRAEGENESGGERQLLFHTFSNTGWLTYGVVLERLLQLDERLLGKIKGCVVDSAPAARPDPQVWANGFSAALLAKRSVAVRKAELKPNDSLTKNETIAFPEPHVAEAALLALLEKFFKYFLMIPTVKDRLSELIIILTKRQPPCPQLYIYSTADRVIPHTMVESFVEQQRQEGRVVRACNLQLSPHVDHFRTFPDIYGNQLQSFLKDCINKSCKQ